MSQLILTNCVRMVNLIAEDEKGHLGEFLHREKSVELGFGFGQTFVVFGIDEENNAGHFGEIILPETSSWLHVSFPLTSVRKVASSQIAGTSTHLVDDLPSRML